MSSVNRHHTLTGAIAMVALVTMIGATRVVAGPGGGDPSAPKSAMDVAPTVYPFKKVTAQERDKVCRTYEGTFISYYGELWRVEDCRRRAVRSQSAILDIVAQVNTVTEVEGKVIAVLPEGVPLADDDAPRATPRGCQELEGHFVTHSYLDIFLVENCKKRLIPDWETYLEMKAARRDRGSEILSLDSVEFRRIPAGKDFESAADVEFHKLMDREKTTEIIPAKDACQGLEGQFASYYSRLYKVENCRKREIDPDHFFDARSGLTSRVVDMTPEQWISIPDGKPMPAAPEAAVDNGLDSTPTPEAQPSPTLTPTAAPVVTPVPTSAPTPVAAPVAPAKPMPKLPKAPQAAKTVPTKK